MLASRAASRSRWRARSIRIEVRIGEPVPTDGLFDPNLHDAVAQEPCDKGEEGRILKVSRKGYKLKDRLLRPASVVVSQLPGEDSDNDEAEENS